MLKPKVALQAGEVIDATFMSKRALRQFLEEQIEDAKKQGVLFSLHMKATMMKISDPKIFGHAVTVFYKDVFEKHGETLKKLGVDPDNGLGDLYAKIKALPDDQRRPIEADIQEVYKKRPPHGDGEFRQRDHQFARAQRHHYRCFHAAGHSRLGENVGSGRQAAGHQSGHPRRQLRAGLS